jgi:xanthine dehydrogenase accessory factor
VSTQREPGRGRTGYGSSTPEGAGTQAPSLTRDPVCGMTVAASESALHVDTPGGRVSFCGTGCRTAYLDNPAAYPSS